MTDIEKMTSDERVGWVLTTPRSERPGRGPLPRLGLWRGMRREFYINERIPDHLAQEVRDGFLTTEEALSLEGEDVGRMSSKERVEYVLATPKEKRPRRGPLGGRSTFEWAASTLPDDLAREVRNGYLTPDEATAVGMQRKEQEAELEPILHVTSPGFELKVYPGYLEWGTRLPTWGKFSTLPFSRILKIERRRHKGVLMQGIFARDLCIVATDGAEIELSHISKEHAELVTQTIYRAMGGDHTRVGKIDIWDK